MKRIWLVVLIPVFLTTGQVFAKRKWSIDIDLVDVHNGFTAYKVHHKLPWHHIPKLKRRKTQ
jgi:hypothetical protein